MSGKPCILLVFGFVWIFCITVEAAPFFYPPNTDPDAPGSNFDISNLRRYLEFFGYYPKEKPVNASGAGTAALADLQRFAGLKVTGLLNKETVTLLRTQRCGKDDADALRQMKEQGKRRRKRYYLQGSRWESKDLTYRFKSFTPDLEEGKIREIMKTSLGMWSAASTLSIREEADPTVSDDDVDILIRFVSGYHFDPYPFDGPGGTLAHAYYPLNNKGLSGDAHFDDDERFTTGTSDGINLDWVAVHEFGHSLGLHHSSVRDSIMYPWYKGYFPNIELTYDDIQGIQALYGKPRSTTAGPTTNEPTTVPGSPTPEESTTTLAPTPSTATKTFPPTPSTEAPGADICSTRWDAAFERSDGRVYVLANDYFWVLSGSLKVELGPLNISSRWKELSRPVDEAYTRTDGKTVFFSGKQYWVYNQDDTWESGPKPISDFGLPDYVDHIDAAFVYGGNKKTYFFWLDRYWRYNHQNRAIDEGYPRSINVWGKELASKPGTVMTWPRNGATYFFYGSYYYKILAGSSISVAPNYPKKSGVAWADCKA